MEPIQQAISGAGYSGGAATEPVAALALAIRTTRVFRRVEGAWRQVHHHGSMDDPALLRAYQDLVRED
jgi:hypothetical protein